MRKVLFGEEKKTNTYVGEKLCILQKCHKQKDKRLGKIFQIKGVIRDMTSKWNI